MANGHTSQQQIWCGLLTLLVFIGFSRIEAWSPKPPIYHIPAGDGLLHKSLYPQDGPVEVLVGTEGMNLIAQDPNVVWVVEYYDVNCPHCWYFSAIYPAVAKAIKSATVRVGAFNCEDIINLPACTKAKVRMVPTMIAYNAKAPGTIHHIHVHKDGNRETPLPAEAIASHLAVVAAGRIPIVHPEVFQTLSAGLGSATSTLVEPSGPPGMTGWTNEAFGSVQTRFHDSHIGISPLLRDGYTSAAKYQAAIEVVEFVGKAFGKDESQVFTTLINKLKATPNMDPAQFRIVMADWESQFDSKWGFCKTPATTCGVWQLFHGISALIAIKYAPIPVSEALPKYRFMVNEFLDCEVCRRHFVESFDACLFGACEVLGNGSEESQAKALVMWLWRTHNAVSVRVISEHPPVGETVDRRWPAFKDCPGCWRSSVVNGQPAPELKFQGQTNDDQPVFDVFNEEAVYGFILFSYLGEDKPKQLFQLPSLVHLREDWSSHTVIFTQMGTIACIGTFVLVAQRIWKQRSHVLEETAEELLEAPDEVAE